MSTIRLAPSDKSVECQPGDTVLSALERQGFALDNNCRAGACGECKTKVLDGEVDQGVVLDMALSSDEREAGYRLMCMAKPLSAEVTIEFGSLDARPKLFAPKERVLCVVTDTRMRTERIREVRLRPVGDQLRYWPGQYVMVGDERNGHPPRPYSIANAPRNDAELVLLVSRAADGNTSTWLHDTVDVGQRLTIAGPYGTFIGDPGTDTPVLCLAAGSGLAPILALTEAALRRGFSKPVTILFSASSEADVFDQGLVSWWTAKHRRFTFLVTYTGEEIPAPIDVGASSTQLRGRIPDVLGTVTPDLSGHSVFIAGSPDFVRDCQVAAVELGAVSDRLHVESYTPSTAPA